MRVLLFMWNTVVFGCSKVGKLGGGCTHSLYLCGPGFIFRSSYTRFQCTTMYYTDWIAWINQYYLGTYYNLGTVWSLTGSDYGSYIIHGQMDW